MVLTLHPVYIGEEVIGEEHLNQVNKFGLHPWKWVTKKMVKY
jgi:hypothetical protein